MELVQEGSFPYFKLNLAGGQTISYGTMPMSTILKEIQGKDNYKKLITTHPEINDKINKSQITCKVKAEPSGGNFTLKTGHNKGGFIMNWGNPSPLGDFIFGSKGKNKSNAITYFLQKSEKGGDLYGYLESENIGFEFRFNPLSGTTKTIASNTIESIKMPHLLNIFKKDSDEFINPVLADQQIGDFVNAIGRNIISKGTEIMNEFVAKKPTIVGYASMDANPSEEMTGVFPGCPGKRQRQDYDKCLSKARAKKIADKLNAKLSQFFTKVASGGNVFSYDGLGYPMPYDKTNPVNNRRFELKYYGGEQPITNSIPVQQ